MSIPENLKASEVASIAFVLICCFAASLGMAFNIDGIKESFNLTNAYAGRLISLEMFSIALGNFFFARLAHKTNSKTVFFIGAGIILLFNLLSILATEPFHLMFLRIPAGLALGAVAATCAGRIAKSDKPDLNFGAINSAVGFMGVFMAFALPRALRLDFSVTSSFVLTGIDGLYLIYSLCAFFALLVISRTPTDHIKKSQVQGNSTKSSRIGWLALVGIGVMFFGHGTVGLFIVRIGREIGLRPENIGYIFMVGSSIGIILPLIAGWIGTKVRAFYPTLTLVILLSIATGGLSTSNSAWQYFLVVPIFATLPTAIMPIFLGCLSRADNSGKLAASHVAFVLSGTSAAPFVGGMLIDNGGFAFAGGFSVMMIILGALLIFPMILNSDQQRTML
tara:strand:- start:1409 stop:2587 length:1179 start_codon:yes stop_codon:yes gene_type:complete